MSADGPSPTLFQVAILDVPIYQLFSLMALCGAFGVGLGFFRGYVGIGALCLLGAAVFGALLVWRIRRFHAILSYAMGVSGRVVAIRRPTLAQQGRYRYRITFTYSVAGQDYRRVCRISQLAQQMNRIQPGDAVTVLVHPTSPQHALVPALYLAPTYF